MPGPAPVPGGPRVHPRRDSQTAEVPVQDSNCALPKLPCRLRGSPAQLEHLYALVPKSRLHLSEAHMRGLAGLTAPEGDGFGGPDPELEPESDIK
eukprot:15466490-Alexandrium_andersonii.AAC.1